MTQFASLHEQVGKSGDSVSFEFSELKEELMFLNSYSSKLQRKVPILSGLLQLLYEIILDTNIL